MTEIKVYSIEEVCDILHLTKRTIYTYLKEGKLQAVKIGKYWRVSHENLQAFISTGTTVSEKNRRKENQGKHR